MIIKFQNLVGGQVRLSHLTSNARGVSFFGACNIDDIDDARTCGDIAARGMIAPGPMLIKADLMMLCGFPKLGERICCIQVWLGLL